MHTHDDDLTELVIEAAAAAGFDPTDADPDDDLSWLAEHGWMAYRDDVAALPADRIAVVRWSEDDGIKLAIMTRNGIADAHARFSLNALGLALFVAAVGAW